MSAPNREGPATTTRRELLGLSAAWVAMTAAGRGSDAAEGPTRTSRPRPDTPAGNARFAYVGSFATSTRNAHGEGLGSDLKLCRMLQFKI